MALTIASLHLIFVVVIALYTKSRFWTWGAGVAAVVVALSLGTTSYGLLDAISAFIGLGMGLSLIPRSPSRGVMATEVVNEHPLTDGREIDRHAPFDVAPAKMFVITPPSQNRRLGRWLLAAVVVLVLCV